ncbi:MAG: glycoside hydrolase family 31 protein [Candidatus Hadarchaeales archaeon]
MAAQRVEYLGEDVFRVEIGEAPSMLLQLPASLRQVAGEEFRLEGEKVEVLCSAGRLEFRLGALVLFPDAEPPKLEGGKFLISKYRGAGERYYGLGEKARRFERSGQRFELRNRDPFTYNRSTDPLYFSVPFLLVCRREGSYGFFLDTASDCVFDLRGERLLFSGEGRGIAYLFIHGPKPSQVLEKFTRLVGRAPLPPLWALGYHQSRFSYEGEQEVLRIAREFRRRQIPCDAIYLDIDYMEGYRCFTWSTRLFPDPERLIGELKKLGFKVVTIVDPGLKAEKGYKPFDEGLEKGYFLKHEDGTVFTGYVWPGRCVFADFAREEVREWWASLHSELLGRGVAGIWNDMNEPTLRNLTPNLSAGLNLPAYFKRICTDDVRLGEHPFRCVKNYYPVWQAQATWRAFEKFLPGKRPFILSRSGWAGIQKYAAVWTGDNYSTWDHLKLSVEMILSIGISGIPFVGADIGGFTVLGTRRPFLTRCSPELFARWIQVGVFYPFCRTHTSKPARHHEPWCFGKRVERIARDFIRLRYSLLPYLYSLFWEHTRNGMPILRPLFLHWPEQEECYREDEFMFGPFLLVAPVFKKGQRRREVYLPPGSWYDFWSAEKMEGGKTIVAEAPLERIPIFARAGAIIPTWPPMNYVGEKPVDELVLQVYPGEGEFELYEDDGESLRSEFSLRKISVEGERGLLVRVGKARGGYRWGERKLTVWVKGMHAEKAKLDGKVVEVGREMRFSIPDDGEEHVLELKSC